MEMGTVQRTLESKFQQLEPELLVVSNVSAQHHGHASTPGTGESHFEVKIVSAKFEGLSRVARQRLVYSLVREELNGPVHALALETKTPQEAGLG